jgi:exopolyphosphatase / guanosine-5'-triphosphate,3'-diphosphate pyrophosphatase
VKKKRLAAIDIGTNSIRSIVVEADRDGAFRVLDDEKATVRLGDGLHKTGIISPDSRRRALEALTRFCKINTGYGVVRTEAIATSAVRKAENGDEFIREIQQATGLVVSVISGEEEAELAALSAFNNFDLDGNRHLLADLGGGSLELVTSAGRHLDHVLSLELGAVYLSETFLTGDPLKESHLKKLRRHIRGTLRTALVRPSAPSTAMNSSMPMWSTCWPCSPDPPWPNAATSPGSTPTGPTSSWPAWRWWRGCWSSSTVTC